MKNICPICVAKREIVNIVFPEMFKIRGEDIEVESSCLKCLTCNSIFDDPLSDDDSVSKAYREYRRRHSMVQPEELKKFRGKYNLTQPELSEILGWGVAKLNRYENGSLQTAEHDKELKSAMEPHNLLQLIYETPHALSEDKKKRLIEELQKEEQEAFSKEALKHVGV